MTGTTYEHIALDEKEVPWIVGANTKIVELVSEVQAYGWSPAELHLQHPHLSLGQIHSALAYYWDHRDEIDADVQRRLEEAEALRRDAEPSLVVRKLRAHGWTASSWPLAVEGLAGAWADEPNIEISREGAAADLPCEPL